MFDHLVNWFSVACSSCSVHSSVVDSYICYVLWGVGLYVADQIGCLIGIIFASQGKEIWQPQFPMPDYVLTILISNCLPQIIIQESSMHE